MKHGKLLGCALFALFAFAQLPAFAQNADKVKVVIDGKTMSWPKAAFYGGKAVICPLEYYLADMGARVTADPNGGWVWANKWGLPLTVIEGEHSVIWGGRLVPLPNPALVQKLGTTLYGPMRFFAELMGFKVNWDKAKLTVTLTTIPFDAPKVKLTREGSPMLLGVPAYLHQGSVMAPAERFLTALGATVYWDEPTLAATGGGVTMSAISEDVPVRVTVNGTTTEVKRGVGIINGIPYVPAGLFAREFGCAVSWDRSNLTVNITTKPKSSASEFVVSDRSLVDPKLHMIPVHTAQSAGLLVVAKTPTLTPTIVFARSVDQGQTWTHVTQVAPREMGATTPFDGFGLPNMGLGLCGTIQLAASNATAMPVWLTNGKNGWRRATTVGAFPGTTKRTVSDVVANSDISLMYAAGWDVISDGMCAQLWRSTDYARTWTPLCDINGRVIGGSATAVTGGNLGDVLGGILADILTPGGGSRTMDNTRRGRFYLGDIAPDNTVWGWTPEEFVRIAPNGAVTTLPLFAQDYCAVVDIDAPTSSDVYVLWGGGGGVIDSTWFLSFSHDSGATWSKLGLQRRATTGCLVDVGSPSAWVMARDFTTEQTDPGWTVSFNTDDHGTSHDWMMLSGHNVHDLVMPNSKRAYIISNKISPKTLYLTRWDWL